MYMVMKLAKGIVVKMFGQDLKVPLTTDGVEGAVFVFNNKEDAENFAGGEFEIVEISNSTPEQVEAKNDEPKIIY